MRGNGITSERNTSKLIKDFIFKIYWEQVCLPINYLVYFFKFRIFKMHRRSSQSLISQNVKRLDTQGEMEKMERGRDNMQEFVDMVPDECLLDLSFRWYCVSKGI